MNDQERKALFARFDSESVNRFHEFYALLGARQSSPGKNFHCWNSEAHNRSDKNPSMSVRDDNGLFNCHACNIHGNFNTFYKQWVANGEFDHWGGSYSKMIAELIGFQEVSDVDLKKAMRLSRKLNGLNENSGIEEPKEAKPETPTQAAQKAEEKEAEKKINYFSEEENKKFVENLLANQTMLDLLSNTRRVTTDMIRKYQIGYHVGKRAITFPQFDMNGKIVNIKAYRPWEVRAKKWHCLCEGNPVIPTPLINVTAHKIYVFEGEPDCYCGLGFNYNGITFGSSVQLTNAKKMLGSAFESTFRDKEVVIVQDTDAIGRTAALAFAKDVYPFVRQLKIIDVDKSDINPTGLDPTIMLEDDPTKRKFKDFTDFMVKNGFNDDAKEVFDRLEENTEVYYEKSITPKQLIKVTLDESVNSRYFSPESNITLELSACIFDIDSKVYKYPTKIRMRCPAMCDISEKTAMCSRCVISKRSGFGLKATESMESEIIPRCMSTPMDRGCEDKVVTSENEIIGMITTEDKKLKHTKSVVGIAEMCRYVKIEQLSLQSIRVSRFQKDPDERVEKNAKEREEDKKSGTASQSTESDENEAVTSYIIADTIDMRQLGRPFRIKSVQALDPNNQSTVLFAYEVSPMQMSFDAFKMNDEYRSMLKIFRPVPGQSIAQHLEDRYNVFGNAAGINGRQDLFFLNDLAFFSPIVIDNKDLLPGVSRGWVEVLIAGDTRCGKSISGEFQFNHYRVGEFIGGSKAMSRTGILAGVIQSFGESKIKWGAFPRNDRSMVIIDEMSRIDYETIDALTALRSSGIAEVEMRVRGKVRARVRKIFFSNWHDSMKDDSGPDRSGIELLRTLCYNDAILARFDAATVVRNSDVAKFESKYEQIESRFTSYQCQTLIYWSYSRKPSDVVYEDGFNEALNLAQDRMLQKYHSSTQLVNQEMRAKLMRMSVSLASMLFSTSDETCEKILVKKEHLDYLCEFLDKIYSSPNMRMDLFSKEKNAQNQLGNMDFMENILKYVSLDMVIQHMNECTEKDIGYIFADYVLRVMRSELYIVSGTNDGDKYTGLRNYEIIPKLIGLLMARNCVIRGKYGKFRKTESFTKWLWERKRNEGKCTFSTILETKVASADLAGAVSRDQIRSITGQLGAGKSNW